MRPLVLKINEIEAAFKNLKGDLALRPICHHPARKVNLPPIIDKTMPRFELFKTIAKVRHAGM